MTLYLMGFRSMKVAKDAAEAFLRTCFMCLILMTDFLLHQDVKRLPITKSLLSSMWY